MNMLLKKITAMLLAVLLGTACLAGAIPAAAADGIVINEMNFPDAALREAIEKDADKDKNGVISNEELAAAKTLYISGCLAPGTEISTLKGVELFTNCTAIRLTNLVVNDISALASMPSLKTFTAHNFVGHSTLDLSSCSSLEKVSVKGSEEIKSLLLPNSLKELQCDNCSIESLDLKALSKLNTLYCELNELSALDLSGNPELEFINCSYNHISQLDLSGCAKLGASASDYYLGSQQITVMAETEFATKNIFVPVAFSDSSRIASSSLSEESPFGYDSNVRAFSVDDYYLLEDGVDYTYNVGLDGAEDMSVHIVTEKNFYRVSYLTAENGEEYDYRLVNSGDTQDPPELPPLPDGMVCGQFNDVAENVTQDMVIYAVWSDSHSEAVTDFKNNIAVLTCSVCGSTRTVAFADCLNLISSDAGFEPLLDVNADGIINARDLSELTKRFK